MNAIPKLKKTKSATKDELMALDKNVLVDKIIQLEAHSLQLKNIISKNLSKDSITEENNKNKPFDFTKCHFRRVLLRFLYFGWDYQGLSIQEDSNQTIEHHLFHALTKSCLIQTRETSNYHRCGRTDKGVSAFGQVISISLRSKYPREQQYEQNSITSEMPYCKLLNRLLPKDIRVVAWMPIPEEKPEYSARFDCKKRQYKYYFPRSSLDVAAMREACAHLIGSHDFRHLCKMDVGNGVTEFTREILRADILPVNDKDMDQPTSMFNLIIEGNAFLWHQIRCIMGVLLLIGQRKENPDIIIELLNIEKNPRKPQYYMALDVPLNLFHCTYDLEKDTDWMYDKNELKSVISTLQSDWTIYNIKTTMTRDSLQQLEMEYKKISAREIANCENIIKEKKIAYVECNMGEKEKGDVDCGKGSKEIAKIESNIRAKETADVKCELAIGENKIDNGIMAYTDGLIQGAKPRNYTPLLKRETCSTLEERIEYYMKERKLADTEAIVE